MQGSAIPEAEVIGSNLFLSSKLAAHSQLCVCAAAGK